MERELLSDDQLMMAVGGVSAGKQEREFTVQVVSDEDFQRICKAVREAGKAVSLTFEEERTVSSRLATAALSQGVGKYQVKLIPGSDPQIAKAD